jgi:hypothetical protein
MLRGDVALLHLISKAFRKVVAMFTDIPLALIASILLPVNAPSGDAAPPQVFVELIVKACPSVDTSTQAYKPGAGLFADPINQGKSSEDEHAPNKEERQAAFTAMGCIDVPVPPEWISAELTRQACMSHIGYLIALQYLQQAAAYRSDFPDVGQWECIEHSNPVQGVAGM